jgi:Uri superfamily endonuclease
LITGSPGTYILLLELAEGREIAFGRHRQAIHLADGGYCYVGSALGPGGLAARLKRHASVTKRIHWHIDYLLAHANLSGAIVAADVQRLECEWARWVARRADTCVEGIGASDCSCRGHLFFLGTPTETARLVRAAADELHGRFHPIGDFKILSRGS